MTQHTTNINEPDLTKKQVLTGYVLPIGLILAIFTGLFVYCNIADYYSVFIAKDTEYKYYATTINNRHYLIYQARKFKDTNTIKVGENEWAGKGYIDNTHYIDTDVNSCAGMIFMAICHLILTFLIAILSAILLVGFPEDHYATPKQYISKGSI